MIIHSESPNKSNEDTALTKNTNSPDGTHNYAWTADNPLEITEQWHSKPEHFRIIDVGAGAAGGLVAYKAKKMLKDYELQIYEK